MLHLQKSQLHKERAVGKGLKQKACQVMASLFLLQEFGMFFS
jgi:hypothetical protein